MKQDDTNPLRDILAPNSTDMRTYFKNMSKAFAELCDVYALVMANDPKNVPINGTIWGEVEFPALMQTGNKGGQVNSVSDSQSSKPSSFMSLTALCSSD